MTLINRMKTSLYKIFIVLFMSCGVAFAQQPGVASNETSGKVPGNITPRVAGLGNNAEYMELLGRERQLHELEDSLARAVANVRELFRENRENRSLHGNRIIELEAEIFDVRDRIGQTSARISAIEQDFIINSLQGAQQPTDDGDGNIDDNGAVKNNVDAPENTTGEKSANLIHNDFFRDNLPTTDYAALRRAQDSEAALAGWLEKYAANYDNLRALATEYSATNDAQAADTIFARYSELSRHNAALSDTAAAIWNRIFDDKTYSYNYLLEKLNRGDLIVGFAEKVLHARDERVAIGRKSESEIASYYPVGKSLLLDCEQRLAQILGYSRSLDSLQKMQRKLNAHKRDFPTIGLRERLFIDYEDITTKSPARYNANNPIPSLKTYTKGVIYRILLGTYTRQQPVSIFKNIAPLGWIKGIDGRYTYYAGGYETASRALEALETVKKLGFRTAVATVWAEGNYIVLDAAAGNHFYRVEITVRDGDLPRWAKDIIAQTTAGKEIMRSGGTSNRTSATNGISGGTLNGVSSYGVLNGAPSMISGSIFIVSPFESAVDAEKLAEKLIAAAQHTESTTQNASQGEASNESSGEKNEIISVKVVPVER